MLNKIESSNNNLPFSKILNLIVEEQLLLDNYILKKINYPIRYYLEKKILALEVEIAELANETRTFKYWSKKPSSDKRIILDETADCLHFLISIGLSLDFDFSQIDNKKINQPNQELSMVFLNLNSLISNLFLLLKDNKNPNKLDFCHPIHQSFLNLFNGFFILLKSLNITWNDLFYSYKDKNKINYQRQETNY